MPTERPRPVEGKADQAPAPTLRLPLRAGPQASSPPHTGCHGERTPRPWGPRREEDPPLALLLHLRTPHHPWIRPDGGP